MRLIIYRETTDPKDPAERIVELAGVELDVNTSQSTPQLGRSLGKRIQIGVADPAKRLDDEGDLRCWQMTFDVLNIDIIGTCLYVTAIPTPTYITSRRRFAVETCDQNHLPWEHDGRCHIRSAVVAADGPVEIVINPADTDGYFGYIAPFGEVPKRSYEPTEDEETELVPGEDECEVCDDEYYATYDPGDGGRCLRLCVDHYDQLAG